MIEIKDKAKFDGIVSDAIEKVGMTVENDKTAQRWINAINKAADHILEHGEWITWMPETKSIVIWNQETNGVHSANGVCDCRAYFEGFPCFHRAAARLIRLYMEDKPVNRFAEQSSAPYLKQASNKKPETVGRYRI